MPLPPAPPASSPAVRNVMRANRSKDTGPEVRLRRELHRRGMRYRKHRRVAGTTVDIAFVGARVVVQVHGCYWHGCPQHWKPPKTNTAWWEEKIRRNIERDRRVEAELEGAGWTVVRVWEHEDVTLAADRVEEAVRA